MSNADQQTYRADGGDISTGRLREIADNPYGDEEKCWLAKRVLALQAELEARNVKIKLPESFYPDGDIDCPLVINEYQVIEAIVAADCKPIAVCPRCKCELDLSHKPDGAHYCHADGTAKGE